MPDFLLSTSSSGQDVASWPRQPRFDSWCGHAGALQRYAATDRAPAGRLRCLVVFTDAQSRLERKLQMQRPARAQMASISCPVDLEVFDLPGSLRARFSSSLSNMHVGARFKTTSSSGQDVALWPRQPRLKSWCGQCAKVAMIPRTLAFQAAATDNTTEHASSEWQVPAAVGSPAPHPPQRHLCPMQTNWPSF